MAMEDRMTLHALVDEIPEPELPTARRFLEYLRQTADPLWLALESAPLDDESVTDDDVNAIREGLADKAQGETLSHDEVKQLLREVG